MIKGFRLLLQLPIAIALFCSNGLAAPTYLASSVPPVSPPAPTTPSGSIPPANPHTYNLIGLTLRQAHTTQLVTRNGIGIADLSTVPGMTSPALLTISVSGHVRSAINPLTGQVLWRFTRTDPDECETNINSTVRVVGRYILIGQSSYTWSPPGQTIANGIGRVCVYDGRTGVYLNTVLGFFGGELFGSQIEPLVDALHPNDEMVAIAAPGRSYSSTNLTQIGAVDIYAIDDILAGGLYTLPISSIQGAWQLYTTSLGNCNGYEFGAAIKNVGDINNDRIDDLIISDPGFCGRTGHSRIALFDSRRHATSFDYSYRSNYMGYGNRYGHSLAVFKNGLTRRILVSDPFSAWGLDGIVDILNIAPSAAITKVGIQHSALSMVRSQFQFTNYSSTFPGTPSRFGYRVENLGDIDGDGIDDAGVSEPLRVGSTVDIQAAGAVHLYSGASILGYPGNAPWIHAMGFFSADDFIARMGYGINSLIGLSDLNGDGRKEFAVSAPFGNNNFGAVYILGR